MEACWYPKLAELRPNHRGQEEPVQESRRSLKYIGTAHVFTVLDLYLPNYIIWEPYLPLFHQGSFQI